MKKHEDKLHLLSEALLEHETLDKAQIDDLFNGKPVIAKKGSRRKQKSDAEKAAKVAEREKKTDDKLEKTRKTAKSTTTSKKSTTAKKTTTKKTTSKKKED